MMKDGPHFTTTEGTISRSDTQFNGQQNTILYNDEQRRKTVDIIPEDRFWSDVSKAGVIKQGGDL